MNEEDSELERLKAKRLEEMQKNISSLSKPKPEQTPEKKPAPTPREIVVNSLGFRGTEVLENAEFQYPLETKTVVEQLSQLIKSGEINEKIDGGQLLSLFRSIGLNVRMNTKINVEQDGKFVSLSDKLSKSNTED